MNKIVAWLKRITPLRIAMVIAVAFALMHLTIEAEWFQYGPLSKNGLVHLLDLKALDLKFKSRVNVDLPEPRVVVAGYDEKAVERFGLWPPSRTVIGDFISAATKGGAKVIAFDGTWSDEDRNASYLDIKRFHDAFNDEDLSPTRGNRALVQQLAALEKAEEKTQSDIDDMQKRLRTAKGEAKRLFGSTLAGLEQTLGEQKKLIAKTKGALAAWNERAKEVRKVLSHVVAAGAPDDAMARALAASPNVIMGFVNYYQKEDIVGVSPEGMAAAVKHLDKVAITQLYVSSIQELGGAEVEMLEPAPGIDIDKLQITPVAGIRAPLPKFGEVIRSFGYFNITPDDDGPMRKIRMLNKYQGKLYPALSLITAARYFDGEIRPMNGDIKPGLTIGSVNVAPNVDVPTDMHGRFMINYYTDPTDYFPTYSIADFIDGTVPTDAYAGKVVLFGMTAQGLFDLRPTPFAPNVPGVYIHASAIQNIIDGRYLERFAGFVFFEIVAYLLLGLLLGLTISRMPPWAGALSTLGFAVGLYFFDVNVVFPRGIWMLNVLPTMQAGLTLIGINLHGYLTEGKEKRMIRKAFQFYLSKSVVDAVLKDKSKLTLGGEKAVCTVLFSDVRGFTTISERLSPEQLVSLLNEYLTPMTNIVLQKYDGTLDKYIGDAIMAFFGAPIHYADHAKRACWTSLDMLEELARLKVGWQARGLPDLDIGVGLNTGPVSVGNMGSHERFNYTVMGDHVNLASRLEGINKQYHSNIIISQFTFEAAKADIHAREMDSVRVKGKREPVRIYELLGKGPAEGEKKELIEMFEMGITLYKSQMWEKAIANFETIRTKLKPNDYASEMYIARCKQMMAAPPQGDWDGVYTMTTK